MSIQCYYFTVSQMIRILSHCSETEKINVIVYAMQYGMKKFFLIKKNVHLNVYLAPYYEIYIFHLCP